MRALWILALGLATLAAVQGCKRRDPKPLPGPQSAMALAADNIHAPGIAWFQGSLDEAFARTELWRNCTGENGAAAPRASELARARKRPNEPFPMACETAPCPPTTRPRHRLI
jgi:hypothetical protein